MKCSDFSDQKSRLLISCQSIFVNEIYQEHLEGVTVHGLIYVFCPLLPWLPASPALPSTSCFWFSLLAPHWCAPWLPPAAACYSSSHTPFKTLHWLLSFASSSTSVFLPFPLLWFKHVMSLVFPVSSHSCLDYIPLLVCLYIGFVLSLYTPFNLSCQILSSGLVSSNVQ